MIDGEHKIILKTNQEKTRKLHERQDLALVNLSRVVEAKKAEKLKDNLHLIDFPKQNTHIKFVSDHSEKKKAHQTIDQKLAQTSNSDPSNSYSKISSKNKKSELEQQILSMQSQNKQQYKRLADALNKSQQYLRV